MENQESSGQDKRSLDEKEHKDSSSENISKDKQSLEATLPEEHKKKDPENSGQDKPTLDAEEHKESSPEIRKATKDDAKEILRRLAEDEAPLVLTGIAGTGKTWLAKQITKEAVSSNGSYHMSLWLSLKDGKEQEQEKNYESLKYSIARQLSIPTIGSVWEDDDDHDDDSIVANYEKNLGSLKDKVKEKLTELFEKKEKEAVEEKEKNEGKDTFLLLVLDSEGVIKFKHYDYIVTELIPLEELKLKLEELKLKLKSSTKSTKILITTRDDIEEEFKSKELRPRVVKIQPLSGNEAKSFLENKVQNDRVSKHNKFKKICDAIGDRSKVLPAQIIMLAEALNRIAEDGFDEALERAFDAALKILQLPDRKDDPIPLLHLTYEMLPADNCLIDCFWHSWNFLGKRGGVQYNELITHWMLEGHLDLSAGIKAAYGKGYLVMTELIDRGMLRMQNDNLVVLEGAISTPTLTLDDLSCRGLYETSKLGLASVLEGENRKVFERMAPSDGMMKTVSVDKKGSYVDSLLIDGSHLCREVPETFFEAKQKLKVLALFRPRLTLVPKSISEMKDLCVLVLRGCYLLNDVKSIMELKKLVVLEISGSPFLKELPEEYFDKMSKLRSLNLSALGIKSLPRGFSNLTELRRLVLRECSFLETLPRLGKLKQIEVIDVSGCSSFIKFQEKCFKSFTELRFINVSGTKIEKLPIVQTLPHLTILLVRGCERLSGMRFMKHLPSLKVLDVFGAIKIKEIFYDCFDKTDNLRILDLSKSEIMFLPQSLGKHLCDLRLKGCPKLEKLCNSTHLTELQSLDLSDCSGLTEFPDNFFENLKSLQSLNLSNTKPKTLPSLSELKNLRHLFLKGCSFEKPQPPEFKELEKLETIDLSGYKDLSEIDTSFEHMSQLQVLDLSETAISCLPTLCKPSKLQSLILRNCSKLETSPNFEILTRLEELDLRGTTFHAESLNHLTDQIQTLKLSKVALDGIQPSLFEKFKKLKVFDVSGEAVESLPRLDGLSNLQKLLLRGCSSLKELPSLDSLSLLEELDLSGTQLKNVAENISKLAKLKRLHLPNGVIEEFKEGEKVKFLPLEVKLDICCISKISDIPKGDKKPRIIVQGTEIFESLKKNSELLEKIRHSISSVRSHCKDEDSYGDSRKHIFSDIYAKIRNVPPEAKDGETLEIQGFDKFPTDIEVVLDHVKYVFLVENNFLKNLSDLMPCILTNIKGCWLERCNRMERIFTDKDLGKWENLEILWISNLPMLKSLYDEKLQSLSFGNLKHLYIDCCPMLETVFSTGLIPENLETLKIVFCDNLKTVFEDMGSANEEEQITGSANQTTSSVVKEVQASSSAKSSTDKAELTKSSADKKEQTKSKSSVDKKDQEQAANTNYKEVRTTSRIKLKHLHISCCSMLESVFSSVQLPKNLENWEIIEIKRCDKLKSVFGQEMENAELPKLRKLHLLELPDWTMSGLGFTYNKSIQPDIKLSPNIREKVRHSGFALEEITGAHQN